MPKCTRKNDLYVMDNLFKQYHVASLHPGRIETESCTFAWSTAVGSKTFRGTCKRVQYIALGCDNEASFSNKDLSCCDMGKRVQLYYLRRT